MKLLEVSITSSEKMLFEGQANSVIVPGEQGVFQIFPFHKPVISRLLPGAVYVDGQSFAIKHGIVKSDQNTVTALVDLSG